MSTTDSPPDTGPRVTREQMRDLSTLRRARDQRMIAGVAEGLSRHFDVDPLLIRVVLAALTLFGGAGIALYVIAWVAIPEEGQHDSALSKMLHRDPVRVMVAGLAVAVVIGVATMVGAIGFSAPNPVPLIIVSGLAIGAFALFSRSTRRIEQPPAPGGADGPFAPPVPPMETPMQNSPTSAPPTASSDVSTTSPPEPATEPNADTLAASVEPAREWWQRPAPPVPPGPTLPPGAPPPGVFIPPPPRPPKAPRSHLFGLTMAVIAIALGVLWILDETTYPDIPASAYPATVLGVTALALIVGAWFGRSRLLIALGVIASLVTLGSVAVGDGPYGQQIFRPTDAAMVQDHYQHGVGQLVVHLESVQDPTALVGRVVTLDQHIGQLQVIVPSTLPVRIAAHVDHGEIAGPDSSTVTTLDEGGQQIVMSSVGADIPALTLNIHLDFGQILITQYDCPPTGTATTSRGLQTTSRIGETHVAAACH